MTRGSDRTGILVKCRVHPLALLLLPCKTTVTIDGSSVRERWGERFFPCEPGSHQVQVSFRYLWERLGDASIDVEVGPGETLQVDYQSPSMLFLFLTSKAGSIEIASRAA